MTEPTDFEQAITELDTIVFLSSSAASVAVAAA